ncbi:MAG: hypothetical protein ACLSE6_07660 [Alphaproteobacteria bacterium]
MSFTTDMRAGVKGADVVMIAVGTPPHPATKEADLQYIYAAAGELLRIWTVTRCGNQIDGSGRDGDEVEAIIRRVIRRLILIRFLCRSFTRRFYIHDFFNPDRIVIGANSDRARQVLLDLYRPFGGKPALLVTQVVRNNYMSMPFWRENSLY